MKKILISTVTSILCIGALAGCCHKSNTAPIPSQPTVQTVKPMAPMSVYAAQAQLQQQMMWMQQQTINNMRLMAIQQQQMLQTMNLPMQPVAISPANMQQFNSTHISYQGSGNNAVTQVTQTWKDANGNLQTKTYNIPANQTSHIVIVNGQLISS